MKTPLIEESQQNTNWIVIIIGSITSILFGLLSLLQICLKQPVGNHPAPNWLLLLFFVGSVTLILIFSAQKLKVSITEEAIYIRFGIFMRPKIVYFYDINKISFRKYDAIKEFMGWGVKFKRNEKCFTVSGDTAIVITLLNNKKILIGTQKLSDFKMVLEKNFKTIM